MRGHQQSPLMECIYRAPADFEKPGDFGGSQYFRPTVHANPTVRQLLICELPLVTHVAGMHGAYSHNRMVGGSSTAR
jgi:hypothetical protein